MRRSPRWSRAASRAIYAALSRPSLLPQSYTDTIDLESDRVYLAQLAGAAGELGHARRARRASRAAGGAPPALGISAAARRRRAAGPAAGARPVRPALSCGGGRACMVAYQRGLLPSRAKRRPRRRPRPYLMSAAAPFGALGAATSASSTPVRHAAAAGRRGAGGGQYTVAAGVYHFSAADAGAALSLSYGFVPQDSGAGGDRTRRRAISRRRAHRPALQVARRAGDDRLRSLGPVGVGRWR